MRKLRPKKSSRQEALQSGCSHQSEGSEPCAFPPRFTILMGVTLTFEKRAQEVPCQVCQGLLLSRVSSGSCALLLPCWCSLQVHQGGAAEPLGATGPHQYAHPFQEDHPAEPAAEAGGGAHTQGEHGREEGWYPSHPKGQDCAVRDLRLLSEMRKLRLRE